MPNERPTSRVRPLQTALRHQWMAFNTDQWTNTETADCDDADWYDRLDELLGLSLPEPAFVAVSPWKGSAHLGWIYDRPINNADPRQVRLRRGVKRGLAVAFGADPRFANRLQKNPWHVRSEPLAPGRGCPGLPAVWDAYAASGSALTYHTQVRVPRPIALLDLFRPLAAYAADRGITLLQPADGTPRPFFIRTQVPQQTVQVSEGDRGSRLFHAARVRVYRARTSDVPTIRGIVSRVAAEFGGAGAAAGVDGVTASIARFMREDWTGPLDGKPGSRSTRDVDHGVMTHEADADGRRAEWDASTITEKRIEAARRSAAAARGRTDDVLCQTAATILAAGEILTQSKLAELAGKSLATVKRRWKSLSPLMVSNGPNPPLPPSRAHGGVDPRSERFSKSSAQPSSTFASISIRDRRIRRAVAAFAMVVEVVQRPGAVPVDLPDIPHDVAAARPVREACYAAETAVANVRRRVAARVVRHKAANRRKEFEERLRADSATAWTWWRRELNDLDETFDALESRTEDPRELAAIQAHRKVTIAGRWRSWRAAIRTVENARRETDVAIPW